MRPLIASKFAFFLLKILYFDEFGENGEIGECGEYIKN